MSRITPIKLEELDTEMQAIMAETDKVMGFTPNDALVMAHKPDMFKAVGGMVRAVYQAGSVPLDLKKLVAVMTSSAAGCQYCEAHTQHGAMNEGIAAEKLAAIWEYQSSDLFTEAERAALDVARTAAFSPNETTDENFAKLKAFYTDEQIVELVGVIAMFGFLNRWNSTIATELEQTPLAAVKASGLKK